jgi:threonine dehydratase
MTLSTSTFSFLSKGAQRAQGLIHRRPHHAQLGVNVNIATTLPPSVSGSAFMSTSKSDFSGMDLSMLSEGLAKASSSGKAPKMSKNPSKKTGKSSTIVSTNPSVYPLPQMANTPVSPSYDNKQPHSSMIEEYAAHREGLDTDCPVSFEDICTALFRIRPGIKRTSLYRSYFMSKLTGMNVFFKNEFTQHTGSFKERGARNSLLLLSKEQQEKGVMAASAGNHALALAWHGSQLGIPVTVFMPTVAPITKVDKCRKFGANVIIQGDHIGEAKEYALSNPEFKDLTYINGYDDPEIVAGAGTCGIEIMEQINHIDYVIVPVGGAGLIAGVSLAVKTLNPAIKVIGVEPENAASYTAALAAGRPVDVQVNSTLGDGLAVPKVGPTAFEVARRYVDEIVTVDEKMISLSLLRLIENEHSVVEGGGAAGVAGILPGGPLDRPELKDKNVVVLLCGGNIDITTLGRVIERGLSTDKRLIRFVATVSDRPGGIAQLTTTISSTGASIKDMIHERAWLYSSVDEVNVKCIVETTGEEHSEQLRQALLNAGYQKLYWEVASTDSVAL